MNVRFKKTKFFSALNIKPAKADFGKNFRVRKLVKYAEVWCTLMYPPWISEGASCGSKEELDLLCAIFSLMAQDMQADFVTTFSGCI